MGQKEIIKIILMFSIVAIMMIVQSVTSIGIETKFVEYQNETLSITPQLEIIPCEIPITSVFKIQRENYTSESEILRVNYIQELKSNYGLNESNSIEKDINKYSSSQTGNIYVNESGNFSLKFIISFVEENGEEQTQIKEWFLESSCDLNENEINETDNTNLTNQTNQINETEGNITETNNETIGQICFENYGLETNENIFLIGEQIQINFFVEPIPSNFSVTYWIEDLYGEIIKSARTSTNLNSKSHTFSAIEEEEKSYFIKGILSDNCQHQEIEKLIVLKNEREENELNSAIMIEGIVEEIKENIHYIRVEINAYKGDTTKTVIELYAESIETNKKISLVQKIKMPDKYSSISNTIYIPLFEEESQIKIIAKGLDVNETKVISLEKIIEEEKETIDEETNIKNEENGKEIEIISAYTKHKKEQEEITWYVSVDNKIEEFSVEKELIIFYNNESQKINIKVVGKETYKFSLKNIRNGTEIITLIKNGERIEDTNSSKVELEINEEVNKEESTSILLNNLNELKEVDDSNLSANKLISGTTKNDETINKTIMDETSLLEKKMIEILVLILVISAGGILIWKRKEVFKSLKRSSREAENTI